MPGRTAINRSLLRKSEFVTLNLFPTARFALASAVLHNRILAMGGAGLREEGFKNFDVVESYDPASDKWRDAGFRLPYPAAGLGACVHNNRLFIIGGNSGGSIENRFACHDLDLNKWTGLEQMDEGRIVMGIATIGDTLYIIGGRGPDGKTPVATVLSLPFPLMFHPM